MSENSVQAPVAWLIPWRAALLLAGFVLLVLLRLPQAVAHGRFYAEEATNFFAYAWHTPWREALFHPLGGYLNIVATGSTLVAARLVQAGWLPLEAAPYVTMLTALFFQLCPALLIVRCRDGWLAPRWAKPLALFLLATIPATEEVWLHSLHSQFHLTVCVALIMVMTVPPGRAGRLSRLALLFLAPLTGLSAIVLLPVLAAKAWAERSRERAVQAATLAAGAAVQLLLFYAPVAVRSFRFDPAELLGTFAVRHVALPLGSPAAAYSLADWMQPPVAPVVSILIAAVLIAALFGPLALDALRQWREPPAWLLCCGGMLAGASFIGALAKPLALLQPFAGQRYSFAPQVLFDLAILALFVTGTGRLRKFARVLLGLLVFVAIVTWPFGARSIVRGPDWGEQVAAWKKDPNYPLMAWPARWTADLSPQSPACDAMPAAQAPSWCEESWTERQKIEVVGAKPQNANFVATGPELGKAEARCRAGETGPALLVGVTGLKDRVGNLKLEVYPGNDEGFLDDDDALVAERKVFRRVEQPVGASAVPTLCVRLPGPGVYTMVILHDRNADHKFNFTSEGIAFSGKARIDWGLPKAKDAAVVVTSAGLSRIAVVMNYRTGFATFGPAARQ